MKTAHAKTEITVTNAQMTWAIKKGFAWADPANDRDENGWTSIYHTKKGSYTWEPMRQLYVSF